MIKKILHFLFFCLLLATNAAIANFEENIATGQATYSQSSIVQNTNFLPVEKAFQLTAETQDKHLILNWYIASGYYLYRDRFNFFSLDHRPLNIRPHYEAGQSIYDDYYEKNLEVYYHQTRILIPLKDLPQKIVIESQGCADAGLCYPPRRQTIFLDSDKPAPLITEAAQQKFSTSNEVAQDRLSALPLMLMLAFLGGLILNLMPCVFPILSIKAMSLSSLSTNPNGKYLHGLAYTAGIIISFIAIGALLIILRSAGAGIGWGFQLQSPVFIGLLIYLFVLMGLNFSGWLTLGSAPMSWGQKTTEGNNLISSFMTGLLATLVASPCTAPFMGTALGFALTQPIWTALSTFIFLGLGMAFPILLITCLPSLSKKLPRPGAWMDHFKQFLAFPLYLTSVWLLWVLGRQTNSDTLSAVVCGVVLMLFAIWLLKIYKTRIIGLVAIAAFLSAFLLLFWDKQGMNSQNDAWRPYSADALNMLIKNQNAVFVNLSADWCITCLVNEKLVLNSKSFLASLESQNVIYMRGDWTSYDPEITKLLNNQNRSGVPLYLFYPSGETTPIILPQILTVSSVIDAFSTKIR